MKKILLVSALLAATTAASAADLKPYVEGQLGYYNVDDIKTETWTGSEVINGSTLTSASAKIKYDNAWGGGLELGLRDVGIDGLRLAASYQRASFDMKKVTGSATVDGTNYTEDITSVIRNDLGINLDNHFNLYMLNAYYDFKNASSFTPFVGVGVGMADIQHAKDNEFAYSLSAGGKYYFDKNIYVGIKATYTSVNGPKDELGIEYKDIDMYSGHALLGFEF